MSLCIECKSCGAQTFAGEATKLACAKCFDAANARVAELERELFTRAPSSAIVKDGELRGEVVDMICVPVSEWKDVQARLMSAEGKLNTLERQIRKLRKEKS